MARSYDIAILAQKVEQMEGSIKANDVIANPTGDATADLAKVQIDGTKYNIKSMTNYSETEQVIGKWIDGKPVYQKTINCGALPNNTTKSVAHGISDLGIAVGIFGTSMRSGAINILAIPYTGGTAYITLTITASNINLITNADFSNQDVTYITIQYTKVSDTVENKSTKKKSKKEEN